VGTGSGVAVGTVIGSTAATGASVGLGASVTVGEMTTDSPINPPNFFEFVAKIMTKTMTKKLRLRPIILEIVCDFLFFLRDSRMVC
jgi:serine acetyltransferase